MDAPDVVYVRLFWHSLLDTGGLALFAPRL